jgi:hypothetical protein
MTIIKEHNTETGEVIERPMNAEELAQWELEKQTAEMQTQIKADALAKREAALAKLAALGLEPDDLKALGL